jgi:hypothetical protein
MQRKSVLTSQSHQAFDPMPLRTLEPEGWFRLQARLPDTPQLRWWLLSQGDEVVVLDKSTAAP